MKAYRNAMSLFKKTVPDQPDEKPDQKPDSMLRALKDVWDIKTEQSVERVERPVSSDIYAGASRKNGIPPRHQGRRVAE